MLLRVRDVTVHYGTLEAVADVSMDIPEGGIVCLLGANGSGKSTLFKAISGVMKPTSGSIWFQDKRIDGLPADQVVRLGLALVPEGRRLFPHMTVMENLEFGAYSRKDGKAIARDRDEMLKRFAVLRERRNLKARTLSGGEQQMLAIARALMSRPKLLLMDEPLQGLAPMVIQEIADIITSLEQDGISIVLVEHNVRMALGLSQKVYILESGRLVFEGSPRDLSEAEYTKKVYLGG